MLGDTVEKDAPGEAVMTNFRPYPPDWCDEETAAYLLSISTSSLRRYVAEGLLPKGVVLRGVTRWSRQQINDAMDRLNQKSLEPNPVPGNDDHLRERIRKRIHGEKEAAHG